MEVHRISYLVILRQMLTMRRLAQRAEKDLQTHLTGKDSTFPDIAHFLAQYIFHTPQERHI